MTNVHTQKKQTSIQAYGVAKGTKRPPTVVKVSEATETVLSEDRIRELIASVMSVESKATSSLLEKMAVELTALRAELAASRAEVAESRAENAALKLQLEGRSFVASAPTGMPSFAEAAARLPAKKAPRPKMPPKTPPLTQEQKRTIFAGGVAREHKNGLKTIHFSGFARQKVKDIKAAIKDYKVSPAWIRNVCWTGKNILQLMVFEERAEYIVSAINGVDNIKHLPEYDMFHGGDLEKIIARIRRSLDRVPDQMHCVRKTLTLQLQQAEDLKKKSTVEMEAEILVINA